jgi:glycosyltransferase involved in cell wall biosynthesis
MRIAVWYNLPSGGAKRALYDHVQGLLAHGHYIESWCPPTADQTFLPLGKLVKEHVVPLRWYQHNEHAWGKLHPGYWNMGTKIRAMNEHAALCAEEINHGDWDMLFAAPCWFFSAPAIGKYVHLPKAIYLQEPNRPMYEAAPKLIWAAPPAAGPNPHRIAHNAANTLKIFMFRLKVREELENAQAFDLILTNSLYSRESVLRIYGLDSKVCYLGVDTAHFIDQHKPRERYVVGVGSFLTVKNIDFVIKALGTIPSCRPPLVWIGNLVDASYLRDLKHLATSLEVDFRPIIQATSEEVVNHLNRAAMMVYAPRLEPFGLAALEANACGIPVIGVSEAGVRESIIDDYNGLLVNNDPQTMGNAIQRLLNAPDYAHQLGDNGRKRVNDAFSLECAAKRLETNLNELVAVHTVPPLK